MSEPVISVEDCLRFWAAYDSPEAQTRRTEYALAAFLKGRVPPVALGRERADGSYNPSPRDDGFNACRDIVLQGRKG